MIELIVTGVVVFVIFVIAAAGIRIVRPTEVGIVERLGKYAGTRNQGFHWIIPIIDNMYKVNMTERMADIEPQEVITKDKLNAHVDAVVYYQIKDAQKSLYNVNNHRRQLTSLARTTLRSVIGKMSLTEANENRSEINDKVESVLDKETETYGVEVLRVEIQKIEPPQDVQHAMNEVVKSEQKKIAAIDIATALETEADGNKRAEIKIAEGNAKAITLNATANAKAIELKADAEAIAIRLVSNSANKYFIGNAQKLKAYEVAENTFSKSTKLILDSRTKVTQLISDLTGQNIVPVGKGKK